MSTLKQDFSIAKTILKVGHFNITGKTLNVANKYNMHWVWQSWFLHLAVKNIMLICSIMLHINMWFNFCNMTALITTPTALKETRTLTIDCACFVVMVCTLTETKTEQHLFHYPINTHAVNIEYLG